MSRETPTGPSPASPIGRGPDVTWLRDKYREERDKRMRPEGIGQYVEVEGDFSRYVDDPYADGPVTRAPLSDEVEVLVVGVGLAGLVAAAHLRMAGVRDIRLMDKAGGFGGVWYWNRYPGVQCDIESYVYLPLLEETQYMPTQKYAAGDEILRHAERIGRAFDLYPDSYFQTEVRELRWLAEEQRWLVTTDRGDAFRARFVIKTNAALDRPKLPGIPGLRRFQGRTFHTSRWDYGYTNGDATGGLEGLQDKRVAIIGTGATAIQCIPFLGQSAQQLYVVQRTPSSVDVRGNRPTDPEWVRSLTPGWQKRRRQNFVTLTSGLPAEADLVDDGWTRAVQSLGGLFGEASTTLSVEEAALEMELADFNKMAELRARIDATVKDRATAEALKPWYRLFCKRPTFNDEYLSTFNRPNVRLLDTDGRGIDEVTETALVLNGAHYEVDCIIFATGFEVGTGYAQRAGCEIYGREGRALSSEWADGLKTFHGFYSHNFPNLFHTGITQNGLSYSYTFGSDEQAEHIAELIKRAQDRGVRLIEPTAEAEARWVATIREKARGNIAFFQQCTPGFYNNEGDTTRPPAIFGEIYGDGPLAFYDLVRSWRAGDLEGLHMA